MYQIFKAFFLVLGVFWLPVSVVFSADLGSEPLIRKVKSQDSKEFRAAVRSAFSEYLTILSGNSRASELSEVRHLVQQSDKFLLEFRYEPIAEHANQIVSEYDISDHAKWQLKLSFDYKAVESALFNSGAPIWQMPRPDLLLWLAEESKDGLRRVVKLSSAKEQPFDEMMSLSRQRGLISKLPSADALADNPISESALWGLFSEDIRTASQKIGKQHSLAARIYPSLDGGWKYDALLILPNRQQTLSGQISKEDIPSQVLVGQKTYGSSPDTRSEAIEYNAADTAVDSIDTRLKAALLTQLMNKAIDYLSFVYALQVNPKLEHQAVLVINDVKDYKTLQKILSGLNTKLVIKDVIPRAISGDQIKLLISYVGNTDLLKRSLLDMPYLEEVVQVDVAPVMPKEAQVADQGRNIAEINPDDKSEPSDVLQEDSIPEGLSSQELSPEVLGSEELIPEILYRHRSLMSQVNTEV